MLDKTDYKIIAKYKKKYRANCNLCKTDRGYLTEDSNGICYICSIKKRNEQMSIEAMSSSDFIIKNGDRHYRIVCHMCGTDRGYIHKRNLAKSCTSCAASIRNKKRYRSNDPLIIAHRKLRHVVKSSISRKMRMRGLSKNGKSIFKILPYSVDDLKSHLESRFQPRMNWENYGKWEIDHITPDSWFVYNSTEDDGFKNSWALENLQPLWKADNASKGNRYEG